MKHNHLIGYIPKNKITPVGFNIMNKKIVEQVKDDNLEIFKGIILNHNYLLLRKEEIQDIKL